MPGSIQVSVLDFKELPSSSNSVKLSLGKVEHEAGEKGTFSFPLKNMRDNLIVTICDSEGNRVSQTGIQTMSIIEKGTWDDVFSIDGGGFIQMKLQFFLSDEERNRIRLMRESAMKKKQAEILGSRHEVSDVLSASSSRDFQKTDLITFKASESSDGIKLESSQGPSFTNVTDKRDGTSIPHTRQKVEQKPNSFKDLNEKSLKENIQNDVKNTSEEMTSNKNNTILLQQPEVHEKLLVDLKNNNVVKSEPLTNLVEKSEKQILEDKNQNFAKKMRKFAPSSKETKVNTIKKSEIHLQETDLPKRAQDSSSKDVGSSRLTVSENIKSFSPKLSGEMDKQGSVEKTPQNIKKMISVFESSISQDKAVSKPGSTKSYKFGTSRLVKDYNEKTLKNSEKSSSSRLRNSFSMSDLRENLSDIITKGDQIEFDNNFVVPSENIDSKGNNLLKSPHEGDKNEKESIDDGFKTSNVNVASTTEIVVKGEEIENPESTDAEASNGSFGQAMKIALVVGFGVVVLFLRQRDSRKGNKKENRHAIRNQVYMNRRGSIEEQGRRIGVSRMS